MPKATPKIRLCFPRLLQTISCFILFSTNQVAALESNDAVFQNRDLILENSNAPCEFRYYNPLRYARLEAGYSWGRFIGINEDYAELGLFLPLILSNQSILYTDYRAYHFDDFNDAGDADWALNAGLGIRTFTCNGNILGANLYYDYLRTDDGNFFQDLSLGLEYLGPCWDFRINGYFPIDDSHTNKPIVFTYPDGCVTTCVITETATRKGFDAELGTPLYCGCGLRIYGAVGPYYFDRKNEDGFWGGHARLEFNVGNLITLRARTSYDHVYRSRNQFTVLLTLPFDVIAGCQSCIDCCRDLLLQPVRRNGIIFTDQCCRYNTDCPSFR